MSFRILNTINNFSPTAKKILESFAIVNYQIPSQEDFSRVIKDYDGLLVGLGLVIDRTVLAAAEKLKFIGTATTGLDHIDLLFAKEKNIEVLSLRGETEFLDTITSTSEMALGLLIALIRKIAPASLDVKNYHWERNKYEGTSLYGATLGIIGLGRLGKWMSRYGNALGMKVMAYDPLVSAETFKLNNAKKTTLTELLKESDVISLHLHLSAETENLIGQKEFGLMKDSAVLINTSRGKIVNEADLLNALENKKIAGYACDVLADELSFSKDFSSHPLVEYAKKHDNLLIVPHLGGLTRESRERTDIFITEKIKKFLQP